jgi:hypothetical protein
MLDGFLAPVSLLVSNIWDKNFRGCLGGQTTEEKVSCSSAYPCDNVYYEDINLMSSENFTAELTEGKCRNIQPSDVHGLSGPGCS